MSTFFLNRKLTKICGNILLSVSEDENKLFITSDLSSSSLSDHQYKNVLINHDGTYSNDIHRIFKNAESKILFSGDDYEKHDGSIITTLVINESIPDRFVIMSKNGSDDKSDHTIKKSFDMTQNSKLGKYIRTHLSTINIKYNPIDIDFDNNYISINGIELSSGNIVSINDAFDSISNEYLSNSFSYKKIIPSTIFQFMFNISNLEDDDYWMFVDDIKLCDFIKKDHYQDFIPTIYNGDVPSGEIEIELFDGIILHESNDIPYFYCKCNNKITSSTNIIDNKVIITDSLLSKFVEYKSFSLTPITNYTRRIVIKFNDLIKQSDKISFLIGKELITLIADSLPNNPDFGITDNERFVFNPSGTLYQQIISLSNAFNHETDSRYNYVAIPYSEYLVISSTNDFFPFEIKSISTNIDIEIVNNTKFPIKIDLITSIINTDYLEYAIGSYIKSKIGYHKITTQIPYVDPQVIDGEFELIDLTNKVVIGAEIDYNGEIDTERVWAREKIEHGILSVYPISELLEDVIINKTNISEYSKKYDSQTHLVVGETYLVVGETQEKIIESDGIQYGISTTTTLSQEFIATSEEFTIISGIPKVYIKKYYYDNEVENFRNNTIPEISVPEIVKNEFNWSIKDSKSAIDDSMYIVSMSIPDFDTKDENSRLFTHSWYNISTLLSGEFDLDKFRYSSYDYFQEYFNNNYSLLKHNDKTGLSETIFKGVKLSLDNSYDGYKFSSLLNIKELGNTYQTNKKPLEISIIKNDEHKNILLLLDFSVSDWKAFDDNGDLMVDYAYVHLMSGIKKYINNSFEYGDEFEFPSIPSITFEDGIGNLTNTFRGIKLQNIYDQSINVDVNSIGFIGNVMTVSNWFKQDGGTFGGLIGIDRVNSSIISTFINDAPSGYWKQGDSLPFVVNGNVITFTSNEIYVLAINGTLLDSILPFSYLKGFESFKNYEWYQISSVDKCYLSIKQLLSFSSIKENISDNNIDIHNEVGNIKFYRPNQIYKSYNDKYVISNKNISDINGDIIINNWYTNNKTWFENIDKSFDTIDGEIRLSLILNESININKL